MIALVQAQPADRLTVGISAGLESNSDLTWANIQAFAAKVLDNGTASYLGARALGDAFDERQPKRARVALVLGAAQWILWRGALLFHFVLFRDELEVAPYVDRREQMDPLWDGEAGLSLRTWHAWRDSFKAAAAKLEVDGFGATPGPRSAFSKCSNVVTEAVEMMNSLEMAMTS